MGLAIDSMFNYFVNPSAKMMFMTSDGYFTHTAYQDEHLIPVDARPPIRFAKVTEIPVPVEPNMIYAVTEPQSGLMTLWMSNYFGSGTRMLPSGYHVLQMVNEAINQFNNIQVVDTYDQLASFTNKLNVVLVRDATLDPSVNSGSALYLYNKPEARWIKVTEFESMDVVYRWEDIQGKPVSSAANIDSMVFQRHSHDNLEQLSKIGEDADQHFMYNNQYLSAPIAVDTW